jgi:phosphoribosyl-AMP cyclohydrolase
MSTAPADAAIAALIAQTRFNEQGLVPAIAQDARDARVLMLAWMNREALRLTLTTKDVTYWSRSRNELWRKGANSGHTQRLKSLKLDCDGDTILLQVVQIGPACHTGTPTCFDDPTRELKLLD